MYNPDWITPPGDTIAKMLVERGWTPSILAAKLNMDIAEVDTLLEGNRPISDTLANQLEQVFGVSAAFWLKRDQTYQKQRLSNQPVNAHIDEKMLWVTLGDGRVIGTPLAWYPKLANATLEELGYVEFTEGGLHWENLDEDISIQEMLLGRSAFLPTL